MEKINSKHQTMNTSRYITKKMHLFTKRDKKKKDLSKKIIRALDKIGNISWKSFPRGSR